MSDVDKEKQDSNAADQVQSSSLLFERGLLSEFNASVLQPSNTSGATVIPIPITPTTTTLASLTGATAMHVDDLTDRIWLSATVGWTAVTLATVGRVDVLFKIWRNAVGGTPIFSTLDSTDALTSQTTSFAHVDLTPIATKGQQTVSYFLTAELLLAGSAANVIGPITFTAAEIEPNRCNCP